MARQRRMVEESSDNPTADDRWCAERRAEVGRYLAGEGVEHGRIGECPAWHVAPYVSIWAIESKANPGSVGWWVICGDLPTDYVSADRIKHPRDALRVIADQWRLLCAAARSGAKASDMWIGHARAISPALIPLLEARAAVLTEWAESPSIWNHEYGS